MYDLIELYKQESSQVFNSVSSSDIQEFVETILNAYEKESKIYCCGNGGNAAYVANFITDLNLHPFVSDDKSKPISCKRLHTINLCDSVSTITAIANDIGPAHIFSEQLKISASSNDVLVGFSGSGNSKNIVMAMEQAKEMNMKTMSITRSHGCKLIEICDVTIVIPGTSYFPGQTGKNNNNFHFEDCISKISHIATGILKKRIQDESK